jgi:hypothetical protein
MGLTPVEVGMVTVGCVWLFVLLMGMILVGERMPTVRRHRKIVLRKILWANGRPMIATRLGKL